MAKRKTQPAVSTNGHLTRPIRYERRTKPGAISIDPARGIKEAGPNFDRTVVPHILTFSAIASSLAKVYRNPDEAVRASLDDARYMRNDCFIWQCLQERELGVSLLNWHIEAEDKHSPLQQQLVTDMTAIVSETRDFTEYRRNLAQADWFGRYAIQNRFKVDYRGGKRRVIINHWTPIHGDKLEFRYDDGSGTHDLDQIGIRVGTTARTDDAIAGDRVIEYTDRGMAYFLEPWERALITVHKHTREDAAWEDYLGAGAVHGVGLRSRVYWTWLMAQETLAQLMELVERTGQGIYIYWYPEGNMTARGEVENVAKQQAHTNVVIMPRSSADPDAYGVELVPPNTAGLEALKGMIIDVFARRIKLCILGQELTSEAHAMGIGSGGAEVQRETGNMLVRYDAANLEETLTYEFLKPLQHFNRPSSRNVFLRFRIDTEDHNAERIMQTVREAYDMGARVPESKVLEICGLGEPTGNERMLVNPTMLQQQRLWEQQHGGASGGSQDGGQPGEMSISDLFGPLAPGGDEQGEGGENSPPGPEGPQQPPQAAQPQQMGRRRPVRYRFDSGLEKQPGEEHLQPGATKPGANGQQLRLNENHRWELANQAEAAPQDSGAGQPQDKPWLDDQNIKQRQTTAQQHVGDVDPQMGGLMRAFHQSPDFKKGGQLWSKDVAPAEFDKSYKWMQQNVGRDAGGGKVVDLGNGRLGFSSPAGAIALMPAAGTDRTAKPQVSYTVNTRPVHEAGGGKDLAPVEAVNVEKPPELPEIGVEQNVPPRAGGVSKFHLAAGGVTATATGPAAGAIQPQEPVEQPNDRTVEQATSRTLGESQEPVEKPVTAEHQTEPSNTKPPHEMTRAEFAKTNLATRHKAAIKKALAEGKTVPPEVLADYPELTKTRQMETGEIHEPTHEELRQTATVAQQRLKRAIAQQNKMISEGGMDRVEAKGMRDKIKELRAQHKAAHLAASDAEHEHAKQAIGRVLKTATEKTNPALKPDEEKALTDLGFTPEHIAKMLPADISHVPAEHVAAWKKLGANDQQIAKMFPKGAAKTAAEPRTETLAPNGARVVEPAKPGLPPKKPKAVNPEQTPEESHAILTVAGRSGVAGRLAKAGMRDTPESRTLIERAIASGEIKDSAHLDRVLKSAGVKRGKGTTGSDHAAIKRAIKANSNAANKAKPEEVLAEEADRNGLEPDELKEALDYVEKEEGSNRDERVERESAKRHARKLTGLTAKDIRRFENQGKDYTSKDMPQFDVWADEIKSQYPGSGVESAADLWELIKEGVKGGGGKLSPEKIARAVQLAKEHRDYFANRPAPSPEQDDEPLPFAKDRASLQRYSRWLEIERYTKGEWDKAKASQGQPDNKGEFVESTKASIEKITLGDISDDISNEIVDSVQSLRPGDEPELIFVLLLDVQEG